jgi:hypothetical protein
LFKSRQFIIGIVISIIFLVWALWNERLDHAWDAITHANYWAILPALLLYFAGVWVRALRWRILLRPIVPNMMLRKTFEVVVIGYMANNVLPARMGELVRSYVLSVREGVRKTSTLATIFVERIFDGITMIGFAAVVIVYILLVDPAVLSTGSGHRFGTFLTEYNGPILLTALLFLVALLIFIAVASSRSLVERLVAFGLKFLPGRLHERGERLAGSFIDGLGSLRSPSLMGSVFGLSVIAWLFEASMYYVIGNWGFSLLTEDGMQLPFYAYMMATAFANLGTLIPQAPGYVGVFEWAIKIVLVGAFGALGGPTTSYVVVLHAALLVPVIVLGFIYMSRESLSWRDLTQLEKTRARASEQAHELEGPLTDIELMQEGKIGAGEDEAELERAGEKRR